MLNLYYIIPTNSPKLEEWMASDIVVENDVNNLRTNVPENLFVIKTRTADRRALAGAGRVYTHQEILVEMAKPNWNPNELE